MNSCNAAWGASSGSAWWPAASGGFCFSLSSAPSQKIVSPRAWINEANAASKTLVNWRAASAEMGVTSNFARSCEPLDVRLKTLLTVLRKKAGSGHSAHAKLSRETWKPPLPDSSFFTRRRKARLRSSWSSGPRNKRLENPGLKDPYSHGSTLTQKTLSGQRGSCCLRCA